MPLVTLGGAAEGWCDAETGHCEIPAARGSSTTDQQPTTQRQPVPAALEQE
ncbi:hypothetical protein M3666_15430 [Curtobacterium sp. ODYSSEY 48 V2]|nr:hypothetical protein [Curtobacterium sp. ODYSSEY 48 V2]